MKNKILLFVSLSLIFGYGLATDKNLNNFKGIKAGLPVPSNGGNIQAGIGYLEDDA